MLKLKYVEYFKQKSSFLYSAKYENKIKHLEDSVTVACLTPSTAAVKEPFLLQPVPPGGKVQERRHVVRGDGLICRDQHSRPALKASPWKATLSMMVKSSR